MSGVMAHQYRAQVNKNKKKSTTNSASSRSDQAINSAALQSNIIRSLGLNTSLVPPRHQARPQRNGANDSAARTRNFNNQNRRVLFTAFTCSVCDRFSHWAIEREI